MGSQCHAADATKFLSQRVWIVLASVILAGVTSDAVATEPLDKVKAATVFITAKYRPVDNLSPTQKQWEIRAGTGFIVASEGLILTNAHVVQSVVETHSVRGQSLTDRTPYSHRKVLVLDRVDVRLFSGTKRSQTLPASVLCTIDRREDQVDLALLRVYPRERLTSVDLIGDHEFTSLKQGQEVWSVGFPKAINFGNPNGPEIVIHKGDIAALHRGPKEKVRSINHDAKIDRGNSGGPLVDEDGRVVGVNTFGIGKQDFAIPSTAIRREFGNTLEHRAKPGDRRRTLTVGPDARSRFASLTEAMGAARPGDTILLGAGNFELAKRLDVKSGVWLRGTSRSQTRLLLTTQSAGLEVGADAYSEISDMTISVSSQAPKRFKTSHLSCKHTAGPQTFLHDLKLEQNAKTRRVLDVDSSGSPSIFACRIDPPIVTSASMQPSDAVWVGCDVDARSGAPQLHRLDLPGALIRPGARPAFHACTFLPPRQRDLELIDAYFASPTFVGCYFMPSSNARWILPKVQISFGVFRSNVFCFRYQQGTAGYIRLFGRGRKLQIINNKFVCTNRGPSIVVGEKGLDPGTAIFISVVKTAQLTIANNLFVGCKLQNDRNVDFPGPPAFGNVFKDADIK